MNTKKFNNPQFNDTDVYNYLGTYLGYDIYGHVDDGGPDVGVLYAVYGSKPFEYRNQMQVIIRCLIHNEMSSHVTTAGPQTVQESLADGNLPAFTVACVCAILRHPEYIPEVQEDEPVEV